MNKPTYKEFWDKAFEGYELEQDSNRVRRIFDRNSGWNIRLRKYWDMCREYSPNFDEEIFNLGIILKETAQHSSCTTPQFTDYYYDDKGNCIEINRAESTVVHFNDEKKVFESPYVGEVDRQILAWLESRMKNG